MSDEIDGALTAIAVGAFLLAIARYEMTVWGNESLDEVEQHSYSWARAWGRRGLARWLHRYARPAGYVLIGLGLLLLLLALI